MSSILGKNLQIDIFGESHGKAVGVVLNGLPSGMPVCDQLIKDYLNKRASGKDNTMTSRKELDEVEYLSGVFNGYTTGTPLTMIIYNGDCHSKDYKEMQTTARPSHADYSGFVRYKGFNDIRGGGHFSGRLTTPLVMAGALCKGILQNMGVQICANIIEIGSVVGKRFDGNLTVDVFEKLFAKSIQALSNEDEMREEILQARQNLDSVGGKIECVITGVKAGVGSPMFDGVENNLSKALFGVPAVKGIEFGEPCELRGSVYNDELRTDGKDIYTTTNHDGGINGGITNGMPILFTLKMKPTPSIAREQKTVDFKANENKNIKIIGRHDPCVVVRAVPVVESVTAIALLDMILESKIYE